MKDISQKIIHLHKSSDLVIFWSNFTSIFLGIIASLTLAIYYNKLPSKLPLFFSLAWGENQLVGLSQFFILPFTIFLVFLINLIIAWHLHPSQIIIQRILSVSSAIISFLILVTTFRILYIFI